jgi:zinc ribbon protein
MDHPCHKCGHSVEDGKAFCSQCGAPQIRVVMPETVPPSVEGNATADHLPVFPMDRPSVPGSLGVPVHSSGVQWSTGFRVCGIAASIAFLVAALRLMVPPLAVFGAGCLAVILYRRRSPNWRADAGSGAQLGAISGLLFSGILAIFAALMVALWQAGGQVHQVMVDALQQVAARSNDPQVQAALDFLKTPEGLASKVLRGMVVSVLVSIAAGAIAGGLTGALLSRKNRPQS